MSLNDASKALSFSQRKGIKPVRETIQTDSMDDALRNKLWNGLLFTYWNGVDEDYSYNELIRPLIERLWHRFFEAPIDTLSESWQDVLEHLREHFFKCD